MNRLVDVVVRRIGIDVGDRFSANARKVKFVINGLPEDSDFPVKFTDFQVQLKVTTESTCWGSLQFSQHVAACANFFLIAYPWITTSCQYFQCLCRWSTITCRQRAGRCKAG